MAHTKKIKARRLETIYLCLRRRFNEINALKSSSETNAVFARQFNRIANDQFEKSLSIMIARVERQLFDSQHPTYAMA